jgi:hypothetical protein
VVVGCKNAGSEEDYLGAGSVYRLSDGYALCTFEMLYTMPILRKLEFRLCSVQAGAQVSMRFMKI